MRQADLLYCGPCAFQLPYHSPHHLFHARIQSFCKIFPGNANLQVLDVFSKRSCQSILNRGGIIVISAANSFKYQLYVFDGAAKRPHLIQGGGQSDDSGSRYRAVCRLESYDAAKGSRQANRASRIFSERKNAFLSRYRGGRSSRTSSRNAAGIYGIVCGPECGILRGSSHAEFVHVGFTKKYGSLIAQLPHAGCFIRSHIMLKCFGSSRARHSFNENRILYGARNTRKVTYILFIRNLRIHNLSLGQRRFFINAQKRVNPILFPLNAAQVF